MNKIHIKYYGEVAEKTGKTKEFLDLKEMTIAGLIHKLETVYELNFSNIEIAVNKELVTNNQNIIIEDEIAILSPFAGG